MHKAPKGDMDHHFHGNFFFSMICSFLPSLKPSFFFIILFITSFHVPDQSRWYVAHSHWFTSLQQGILTMNYPHRPQNDEDVYAKKRESL